jgi:N-acetylmuramoyl-L-alanine amidase
MLLLHYTGMISCARAIDWLSRPEARVSCHYVIDTDGRITQMVGEDMRAWHAGVSAWAGETDINSCSIGIEIHNPGHDQGYPDFPEAQMAAVVALSDDIVRRWSIRAERVLGHSDVAPQRKIDPGEKFDWRRLAEAGVGLWVPPAPVETDEGLGPGSRAPDVAAAQTLLARFGYAVETRGELDLPTAQVLAAFQRHFRPARIDGRLDRSTLATIERLLAAMAT